MGMEMEAGGGGRENTSAVCGEEGALVLGPGGCRPGEGGWGAAAGVWWDSGQECPEKPAGASKAPKGNFRCWACGWTGVRGFKEISKHSFPAGRMVEMQPGCFSHCIGAQLF